MCGKKGSLLRSLCMPGGAIRLDVRRRSFVVPLREKPTSAHCTGIVSHLFGEEFFLDSWTKSGLHMFLSRT